MTGGLCIVTTWRSYGKKNKADDDHGETICAHAGGHNYSGRVQCNTFYLGSAAVYCIHSWLSLNTVVGLVTSWMWHVEAVAQPRDTTPNDDDDDS